jgi:hypothetical protein
MSALSIIFYDACKPLFLGTAVPADVLSTMGKIFRNALERKFETEGLHRLKIEETPPDETRPYVTRLVCSNLEKPGRYFVPEYMKGM